MSWLRRLLPLLLLPALCWGQALHQEKVGFYVANKAGDDCSQATLNAADENAFSRGQVLVIPPTDRFGVPCQWTVAGNLTIDSPVFFPYKTTPVLKVEAGNVLELTFCPLTWGDYYIIDANQGTTGQVVYTPSCTQCEIAGDNDWIHCTAPGGVGGVSEDLSDNPIADLEDVNADVTAADEQILIGDGTELRGVTWPSCNAVTEKVHLDPDDNSLSCVADASAGTTTLDGAFQAGDGIIHGALCGTKALTVDNNGDSFIQLCIKADGTPSFLTSCGGDDCDDERNIPAGKSAILFCGGVECERTTSAGVNSLSDVGVRTKTIYFSASALEVDGTNCVYGDSVQINSGPRVTPLNCADSGSSVFEGNVPMLKTGWDAGPVFFTLHAIHGTTEAIVFAGDWDAFCSRDSAPVGDLYGTAVQGDLSIDTANDKEQQTSAAVTPGATCVAGDHLFFRFTVDAATFSANAANTDILGVSIHYVVDTNDGDDED